MRHTNEIEANYQMATVVGSGGTVTATGIDWSPYCSDSARLVLNVGATPSGTVVATLQQGTAVADGYSNVGTITCPGSDAGTAVDQLAGTALTERYLRCVLTSTGGTALVSAAIVGKRRTITGA